MRSGACWEDVRGTTEVGCARLSGVDVFTRFERDLREKKRAGKGRKEADMPVGPSSLRGRERLRWGKGEGKLESRRVQEVQKEMMMLKKWLVDERNTSAISQEVERAGWMDVGEEEGLE